MSFEPPATSGTSDLVLKLPSTNSKSTTNRSKKISRLLLSYKLAKKMIFLQLKVLPMHGSKFHGLIVTLLVASQLSTHKYYLKYVTFIQFIKLSMEKH